MLYLLLLRLFYF